MVECEQINALVDEGDAARIMNIPLSKFWPHDGKYWWPIRDGGMQ